MGSVAVDKAGVGSAVLNSMRQVGGSLGIAVMGAIVTSSVHVTIASRSPQAAVEFVHGYRHALEVAAGIAFVASLIAMTTVRHYRHPEAAEAAA
jgi:mannose/fructose/N-acetylgalactosamine-specific phosphotransferase system component IID